MGELRHVTLKRSSSVMREEGADREVIRTAVPIIGLHEATLHTVPVSTTSSRKLKSADLA